MRLKKEPFDKLPIHTDVELIHAHILLTAAAGSSGAGAFVVELGCGAAAATRQVAVSKEIKSMLALEVDELQHAKNIQQIIPKVTFKLGGMQEIPIEKNATVDAVLMLKSLHHVPADLHAQGFRQVHRVLKPGGKLYISEPVFGGSFNEILRLFHDEEKVRHEAFASTVQVVDQGVFTLEREIHFQTERTFPQGFQDMHDRVIRSTFNEFEIGNELLEKVKQRFNEHVDERGSATFMMPMRVTVLVKSL